MNSGQIEHGNLVLSWGVQLRSKQAGTESGDGFVLQRDGGRILAAVIDGTGSGTQARKAANTCIAALSDCGVHPLPICFQTCDDALANSRGAAMGLAMIDLTKCQLDWAAVGDIGGQLWQARRPDSPRGILQRGGTLGIQYSGIHQQQQDFRVGDLIIMASDGVMRGFLAGADINASASQVAEKTMASFGRDDDDAIVLAMKLDAAQ